MKLKIPLFILLWSISGLADAAFINDSAPAFELSSLDDEKVRLEDFKGRVVFVNFWASWCPPCKKEFPELNELANEYKDQKVKILAINLDKSRERVETFIEKMRVKPENMVILMDPDAGVVADYSARAMPSSFIIDRNGIIKFVHFGFNEKDPVKWREEINSILPGKED